MIESHLSVCQCPGSSRRSCKEFAGTPLEWRECRGEVNAALGEKRPCLDQTCRAFRAELFDTREMDPPQLNSDERRRLKG